MNNEKLAGKLRPKLKISAQLDRNAGTVTTLAGLSDVDLNDLQDGQLLRYNSENKKFENFTLDFPDVPVQDVEVDGTSVVNEQGVAEITLPDVPVQDVEVDGTSVVNEQGVAEITLPDVPVQDVEVNGVSVVNAQGIAEIPLHRYSTTEHVVGSWIDGKPLYEKTLKVSPASQWQTGTEIPTGISNPDFVKITEAYFYDNDYNDMIGTLPYNQSLSDMNGDWIYEPVYKRSTNVIVLKTSSFFNADPDRYLIFVLQYTKTTD